MPDTGGCDPHRDCQSYPRKDFSLFQEMDLSGAGWWPAPQLLTSGSACNWENLPVWLLRPGCPLAPVNTGEGLGSQAFPQPLASPFSPGSLDLSPIWPGECFSLWFLICKLIDSGFTKEERAAPSWGWGWGGGGVEQRESWETHWSQEIRKGRKWLFRTIVLIPETISHHQVQGQQELPFIRLISWLFFSACNCNLLMTRECPTGEVTGI